MAASALEQRVAAVRRFNRLYVRQIGLLRDDYLDSGFSLAKVRVLYELAQRKETTASNLVRELDMDAGYASRILAGFRRRRWIERRRSLEDGRSLILSLTPSGRKAFSPLDRRSHDAVAALLKRVSATNQSRLVAAMQVIETLLGEPRRSEPTAIRIRQPRPGDMGWVVQRHGELYFQEEGYNEEFEALVAGIVAEFIQKFDAKRDRCWIAERDGVNAGCIFLVKGATATAKLRLFLVEPTARGLGIGGRLVDECVRFARAAGYRKIALWTQSDLYAARRIYERAGFHCVGSERHHSFGRSLAAETWELKL
ncbi:MAG TPA: helix-turn-helix domain-containing GNAT family N-acetyltransferase [Phycisphaerae bacterium]|nr:helix-turn-helix domain-containing GNAT family N-acetyltransferase [Phycisphaerae bacterium]